jgi:hypothetical protein
MAVHTFEQLEALHREERRRGEIEEDLRLYANITLAIGYGRGHVTERELEDARQFATDYHDWYIRGIRKSMRAFRESFNTLLEEDDARKGV